MAAAFAGSPLVVHDAATVSVSEARKIISDIDAGRPALIVGGPLLARHKVEWNGKSAFPTVEGVWPEYKTYVKDDRVCYLDRLTGEGFGRGNVWRMKRLVKETEAILIERRKGRPERCVALFGCRKAEELAEPGVRARMNWALKAIGAGALLFEAGTDQFSYDPGETVTVGAGCCGSARARVWNSRFHLISPQRKLRSCLSRLGDSALENGENWRLRKKVVQPVVPGEQKLVIIYMISKQKE